MRHVVMFSGGIASWAAAKRVAAQHGTDSLTLLFCDTKMEDEDLYRFLAEAAANVGGELVRLADGRDPWGVFRDRRFVGNSRVAPCSEELKAFLANAWVAENCNPADTMLYIGYDWTEEHRLAKWRAKRPGWQCEAPLCLPPLLWKPDLLNLLRSEGIRPPRLYELGFAHNNCGGFCCRAGHGHFAHLLRVFPDRYAYHEGREQEARTELGDVAILRDRTGRKTTPLTLRAFRERIQSGWQPDLFDIGGCGCFSDVEDER